MLRFFISVAILTVCINIGLSQCTNPPNGTGCLCSTAPVLCTPDQLDGFVFTMSTSGNLGGIPSNDLCPGNNAEGQANNGNVPNNVNWFAFIAWCTDLQIDVTISNCVDIPGNGPNYGVQMALFANCGSPWNPIQCITNGSDACGTSTTNYPTLQNFNATGLTVGNTYYFMLDGCLGSACTITLDVIGTCGTGTIDPWTQPIMGNQTTCVGSTDTYMAEDLDGATDFHWYLNGALLTEGTELNTINHTWATAGTYQLCVDVSNDPCIPETDAPAPTCITITVYDANAGDLNATPKPACPGETVNLSVTNYNNDPAYEEYLFVTNSSGVIVEVFPGDVGSFTYNSCGVFTLYSLNFAATSSVTIPMVGNNISSISCSGGCCELKMLTFEFADSEAPIFSTLPPNTNLSCFDLLIPMSDLDYTDNCIPDGSVVGIEGGSATLCDGGTITRTWEVSDSCGNVATHLQTIVIDPIDPPILQNPPASVTINCNDLANVLAEDLLYTNGGTGACLISGSISPTVTGSADLCGGQFTKTWNFSTMCGYTLNHVQQITVTETPKAAFVNPPANTTLTCDQFFNYTAPDLAYTNGETGSCEISGVTTPIVNGSADICGGTLSITWEFTDACARLLNYTQTITVEKATAANFVNPPANITVSCENIPTSAPDLTVTNNLSGDCEIMGVVSAQKIGDADKCGGSFIYRWEFNDPCGTPLVHEQTVTVTPSPQAQYINTPPATLTVSCENIPTTGPDLMLTNNASGACLIEGTVTPVLSGAANKCGGTIVITWSHTDDCGRITSFTQTVIVEPAPQGVFLNVPPNLTVACENLPPNATALTISNGSSGSCAIMASVFPTISGNINVCGGTVTNTWSHTDECGRVTTAQQTITGIPAPPAAFGSPPPDVTVSCDNIPAGNISLSYSNNLSGICAINGSVNSSRSGNATYCGGVLTDMWTFTDLCNRVINASRTITVDPAPPASFATPPADITLSCDNIPINNPSLNYTNGLTGSCAITGVTTANKSGTYDECGGSFFYTWVFTDQCGRTINASQGVTVTPAPDPFFVNPPQDITVNCGDTYTPPNTIPYSNGSAAPCDMNGNAFLTSTPNGNTITNVWEFAHPCTGAIQSHTQVVTFSIGPDLDVTPFFIDLCLGQSFDFNTLTIIDLNNTNPVITFHTGNPADASNQISSVITPTMDGVYYVKALNNLNCEDVELVNVSVFESPTAGEDNETTACSGGVPLNLFTYLSPDADQGGSWFDNDGNGINVSDPYSVNLFGVSAGAYFIYYVVPGTYPCIEDEMVLTLNVIDEINFEVLDVSCTPDNNFYEITIFSNGYDIFTTTGDVVVIDENTVKIINIPISVEVIVSAIEPVSFCFADIIVTPPNCGCPDVAVPTGQDYYRKCTNEVPILLTVSVETGLVANWYNTPNGVTPIQVASDTYSHLNNVPGIYNYYIEAYDPNTMCKSNTRLKVTVEIVSLPNSFDIVTKECDDNVDGFASYDLVSLITQINTNASNLVNFYPTALDAQNGTNVLTSPYTSTSSNQVIYATTTNQAGCKKITTVTLSIHDTPSLDITTLDESCLGLKDGKITAAYSGLLPNPEFKINNGNWSNSSVFSNLSPGAYSISVRDTNGCIAIKSDTIKNGLSIIVKTFSAICNNNGTVLDATDDYYEVTVRIENTIGKMGNVIITGDNGFNQIFQYFTTTSFNIPANDQTVLFTITDEEHGCNTQRPVGPLTPCSTDCQVTINSLLANCNDNGTPSNPNDDFYLFTTNVSSINGASTFTLYVDNILKGVFNYNVDVNFSVPADGDLKSIKIQDSDDIQCVTTQEYGPLIPCSDQCILNGGYTISCANPNGTPDLSDDVYTISVFGTLINGGTSSIFSVFFDNLLKGESNYIDSLEFEVLADNLPHTILITDNDNNSCTDTIDLNILSGCSAPCEVNFSILSEDCFNPGSTPSQDDDYYEITISPIILNSSSTSCQVWVSGSKVGDATYGVSYTITIPADGNIHLIEIIDNLSSNCKYTLASTALTPCSEPCEMEVIIKDILCDNNGTNNTSLDDSYSFSIFVTGNGTTWEIASLNESGAYDSDVIIDNILISQGTLNLRVRNKDNINCFKNIVVNAPATCSECVQSIDAGMGGELSCDVSEIMLIGQSSEPGQYEWKNQSGLVSNELTGVATTPGIYTFAVSFSDGCEAIDSVLVTSDNSLPIIDAGQDKIISCEILQVILGGINTSEGASIRYEWTDSLGNVVGTEKFLSVTVPGKYYFQVFNDASNCKTGKEFVLVEDKRKDPLAIIYAEPTTIFDCLVESITLSGEKQDNVENIWSAGGESYSQPTLEIREEGTYTLTVVDTITGCRSESSIIITDLQEYPIINLSVDKYLDCINSSVTINAFGTQVGPNIGYQWSNEFGEVLSVEQTNILTVNQAGDYYLQLVDNNNGCVNTDTVTVSLFENEINLEIDPIIEIKKGQNIKLNVLINIDVSEIKSITWNPNGNLSCTDCLSPTITNAAEGIYTVIVEDIYGCIGQAQIRLVETIDEIIEIPNIININDNSTNNQFTIYGNEALVQVLSMKIYDRWGNLLYINDRFPPNDPSQGWNGTFNKKDVVPGVYVYLVEVLMATGEIRLLKGDLSIIK